MDGLDVKVYYYSDVTSLLPVCKRYQITRTGKDSQPVDYHSRDMNSYVIGDVPSYPLETIQANDSLLDAVEKMFENNYTQLGIERDGEVVGMVSYRSIARVLKIMRKMGVEKNLPGRPVTIAIEDTEPVVSPDEELISLFDLLDEDPYVLVEDQREGTFDILTNYDLLHFIRDSSEPFLLIEEIERSIRDMFEHVFPANLEDKLINAFTDMDISAPETVTDCSFGHYPIFISKNWPEFEEYFEEDRDFVIQLLKEVGDIRNQLFHFRTEDNSDVDREFLKFAHGYFTMRLNERL